MNECLPRRYVVEWKEKRGEEGGRRKKEKEQVGREGGIERREGV